MKEEKQKPVKVKMEMKEIKPLRDFTIACNEHFIEIKKGINLEVPTMFLQNLKTEKVIK